jgi:phosphohistidine phosphatase
MKSLLLVRHAKSSWNGEVAHDFDRPLNDRGKKDAPEMALRLVRNHIAIDAFVSSPARRAKKTATYFIHAYGRGEDDLLFVPQLYHASTDNFIQVVGDLSDEYQTVVLFSHNPGITDYVNTLTQVKIDNMPTCGVFAVRAAALSWQEFAQATKEPWFFNYPKLEQNSN